MGLACVPLGFWYSHWVSVLSSAPFGPLCIVLVDVLLLPFIHAIFLIPYHLIKEQRVLNHNLTHDELIEEIKTLYTVDLCIYAPLQYLNFRFCKSNIIRIVNINIIDLLIDVIWSLIINDKCDPFNVIKF